MTVLTMRSVSLRFGDTTALKDIDLNVEPGEVVAVMGRTGAGKSSLLNIAAGLVEPTTGGVSVGPHNIVGADPKRLAEIRQRELGFVFQNLNLLPRINVLDNVALPLELAGTTTDHARERAREALAQVQLDARGNEMPANLSGGQRQLVAVARAFVTRPRLILADEPAAALDATTAEVVLSLIRNRCDQENAGALVVTHDPAHAAWADRVIQLRDGRIATESAPATHVADLFEKGTGEEE